MKKLMLIFCSVLVVFITGCTTDMTDRQHSVPVEDHEAWMYDETLPVPVILKGQEMNAKATYPINSLADMHNAIFGIFAVNKKKPEVDALFMNNVAQYRHNTTTGKGEFIFGTNTGHIPPRYYLYYPLDSEADYTFTAYSCKTSTFRDEDNNKTYVILPDYEVTEDNKRILVDVPVANSIDVLWGKAEADGDGFNARYIRQNGNPKMGFKHLTAGLSFTASLAEGVVVDSNKDSLFLHTLEFDVTKTSKLCMYDCDDSDMAGKFVEDLNDGPAFLQKFPNGGTSTLYVPIMNAVSKPIGQDIFIKPEKDMVCRLKITYRTQVYDEEKGEWKWVTNGQYVYEFTLDPSRFDPTQNNGFEAGKYYRFHFNIGFKGKPFISSITTRLPEDLN